MDPITLSLIAGGIGSAVGGIGDLIRGSRQKKLQRRAQGIVSGIDTPELNQWQDVSLGYVPETEEAYSQMGQAAGQLGDIYSQLQSGEGGLAGAAGGAMQDYLQGVDTGGLMDQYTQQTMDYWNQEVAPQHAQKALSQYGLRGSAFENAMGKAGSLALRDISQQGANLAQQREQMRYGMAQQVPQMMAGLAGQQADVYGNLGQLYQGLGSQQANLGAMNQQMANQVMQQQYQNELAKAKMGLGALGMGMPQQQGPSAFGEGMMATGNTAMKLAQLKAMGLEMPSWLGG